MLQEGEFALALCLPVKGCPHGECWWGDFDSTIVETWVSVIPILAKNRHLHLWWAQRNQRWATPPVTNQTPMGVIP